MAPKAVGRFKTQSLGFSVTQGGPPVRVSPRDDETGPTNEHTEGEPVKMGDGSAGTWHWHKGSANFPKNWYPLPADPKHDLYTKFPELKFTAPAPVVALPDASQNGEGPPQYASTSPKAPTSAPPAGPPPTRPDKGYGAGADIPPKGTGPSVTGGVPFPVAQGGQPPAPATVAGQTPAVTPKPDKADPNKSPRSSRTLTLPSGYRQDFMWNWNPGLADWEEIPVGAPHPPENAPGSQRDPEAKAVDVAQATHIDAQTDLVAAQIIDLVKKGDYQNAQLVLEKAKALGIIDGKQTLESVVAYANIQNQKDRFGLDVGNALGTYNGQKTITGRQQDLAEGNAVGVVNGQPTLQAGIAVGNVLGQPTLDAVNSQIGTWSQRANDMLARGQYDEARRAQQVLEKLNERKFNLEADVQGEQSHRADIATNLAVQGQEFTQADTLRNSYRNDQDLALRAQGQGFTQMRGNREDYRADVDQALKGQGQQFAQDDALRLGYRADQSEQRQQQQQDYQQQMERRKFASELAQNPASYLQYAALAAGKPLPAGVGLFDALARTGPDVISTSDWMARSGLTGPSVYRYGQNTPTALGYLDTQGLRQPSTDRFGANHISTDEYMKNQGLNAPSTYTYGKNIPTPLGYLDKTMGPRAVANTPIGSGNYPKGPDPVITPTPAMPPGELPKPPKVGG